MEFLFEFLVATGDWGGVVAGLAAAGVVPLALAALDAQTRYRIEEVVGLGGSCEGGRVSLSLHRDSRMDDQALLYRLMLLGDLATALSLPPEDLPSRMARNALDDPEAAVRIRALTRLDQDHPDHPATQRARVRASRDGSLQVRALAQVLGPDADPESLLALVVDAGIHEEVRTQALLRLPGPFTVGTFRGWLDGWEGQIARPGRSEQALVELLPNLPAAAQEPAWTALLLTPRGGVRERAARELGVIGTRPTVAPLADVRDHDDSPRALTRACDAAILAIQATLDGADPGGLAVLDEQAAGGGLSVAAGGGELSVSARKEREPPT